MRKLTNETGLPAPLFHAIKNDTYEMRGDISVTSLIDSPYVRLLRKYNEYEEDAADLIWSLTGQSMHSVIERAGRKFEGGLFYPELKLLLKVEDKLLSGTTDLLEIQTTPEGKKILHDYKNIFVYAYKLGEKSGSYQKWVKQVNIYAYMLKHGVIEEKQALEYEIERKPQIQIDEIYVHTFIRDWNMNKSEYTRDYPPHPVATFKLPVYSEKSIYKYILKQKRLHFEQEELYNRIKIAKESYSIQQESVEMKIVNSMENDLQVCLEEDRWKRPTVWRMVKKDAKRSLKNFEINSPEDEQAAKLYWAGKIVEHPTLQIDKVPGEDIRCVNYCPVNKFCKYFKESYGEVETQEEAREDAGGYTPILLPNDKAKPKLIFGAKQGTDITT